MERTQQTPDGVSLLLDLNIARARKVLRSNGSDADDDTLTLRAKGRRGSEAMSSGKHARWLSEGLCKSASLSRALQRA